MQHNSDKIGNAFLAVCPDGKLYLFPDQGALRQLYQNLRISYKYT